MEDVVNRGEEQANMEDLVEDLVEDGVEDDVEKSLLRKDLPLHE